MSHPIPPTSTPDGRGLPEGVPWCSPSAAHVGFTQAVARMAQGRGRQGSGHHALGSAPEILTLGGLPDDLSRRHRLPSATVPAAITLACMVAFAFGHKQGQEKAAREARQWLELDG